VLCLVCVISKVISFFDQIIAFNYLRFNYYIIYIYYIHILHAFAFPSLYLIFSFLSLLLVAAARIRNDFNNIFTSKVIFGLN